MTLRLLTAKLLEFLSLKGGCTGSSQSKLVKMPHWWKSHVAAQISIEVDTTVSKRKTLKNNTYKFNCNHFLPCQNILFLKTNFGLLYCIRGMFEMNCLLSYISISTWGTIKTNIYLSRFIQGLHNSV